ncbi:MAG: hypothetical protein BGO10_00195 [Chlamydia sp. 32-24]|nr:MAG: hypothetical protein BGO10_00195 [Chlamydia sp. 32-24]
MYAIEPALESYNRSYEVDKASIEDANQITNIVNNAIKNADFFRKQDCDRISLDEVESIINESSNRTWYVLKERIEEECVGAEKKIAAVVLYRAKERNKASLHMFTLRVDLKGNGIGKILLKGVEELAVAEGKQEISLWCANVPRLVRYYNNVGFIAAGRELYYDSTYLREEYIDAIKIVKLVKNLTPINSAAGNYPPLAIACASDENNDLELTAAVLNTCYFY